MSLQDKIVVITGAAGSLGSAAAQKFGEAGATLVLVDNHPQRLAESCEDLRDRYDATLIGNVDVTLKKSVDKLAEMIRPYIEDDTLKFFSTSDFETSLSEDINTNRQTPGGMSPIGLKKFMAERIKSITKQLEGSLPSKSSDGTGNGGNSRMPGGFPGNQNSAQVESPDVPINNTDSPETDQGGNY